MGYKKILRENILSHFREGRYIIKKAKIIYWKDQSAGSLPFNVSSIKEITTVLINSTHDALTDVISMYELLIAWYTSKSVWKKFFVVDFAAEILLSKLVCKLLTFLYGHTVH